MKKVAGYAIGSLIAFPLIIASDFWFAVVIKTMWNWFITRLGVSEITFMTALGLAATASVFCALCSRSKPDYGSDDDEASTNNTVVRILGVVLAILAAFIIRLIMG